MESENEFRKEEYIVDLTLKKQLEDNKKKNKKKKLSHVI